MQTRCGETEERSESEFVLNGVLGCNDALAAVRISSASTESAFRQS